MNLKDVFKCRRVGKTTDPSDVTSDHTLNYIIVLLEETEYCVLYKTH